MKFCIKQINQRQLKIVLTELRSGDVVGEIAALTDAPRTAQAQKYLSVIEIQAELIEDVVKSDDKLMACTNGYRIPLFVGRDAV